MITLVVSCALVGVASASDVASASNTAKFTAEALKTAPGYLVFDKAFDATDGKTITMTMDITEASLNGNFNFGLAILPDADANGLTDENALVWYNNSASSFGTSYGYIVTSGTEVKGASASGLYYKPSTYITANNSIKVEYNAPTESTDGRIALYKKSATSTTWSIVKEYTKIKYDSMSQSENLYIAIMGWWNAGAQERQISFLNPRATDGVTVSTTINARGSVEYTVPSEIDNGDGFIIYADKYTNSDTPIDVAHSYVYYNHKNNINDKKLTTRATFDFDVISNNGLQLVLNETKTVPDSSAVKIAIPNLEETSDTTVVGATTTSVIMKPTGRYEVRFVEKTVESTPKTYAVLYAQYNIKATATTVVEGSDDVVVEYTTAEFIKLSETEMTLDNYYLGFIVSTIDTPKCASIDNLHVVDDPNGTGSMSYDYRCTFESALDTNVFYADKTGDNSVAQISTGAHSISVTSGSIEGTESYSVLVGDGVAVVLKADAPNTGYHFDRWEKSDGTIYSRSEQTSILAAYNLSLTAKYERNEYVITLANNEDSITFYEGVNGNWKTLTAKYGDSVKVVAHENNEPGMVFDGWYNGNEKISSDKVYKFEASATYNALEARYALEKINIQVINGVAKADTDTTSVNYITKEWGTQITATPNTANTSWQFDHWEFDGVVIDETLLGADGSYTFNVEESGKLTAVYSKIKYQVTVVNGYIDGATGVTSKEIEHGTQVVITANAPEEGKVFDGWYSGETKISSDVDYVVTVDSAISVTAKYVDQTESGNGGCAGFIAPPTSNGGNNSLWLVAGMLVISVLAVAIAKRNRTSKESK